MSNVPRDLPTGTVTFLFTDVEGSTRLLHELGPDAYAEALAEHRRVVRQAFTSHGGVEVDTQGDAFFVAFPTAPGAIDAATDALTALADGPIRLRIGIHTGTPHLGDEGYVGADVHRAARIAAAGHGGQVLISAATASLVGTDGLRDLGEHRLKDLTAPERIYQLGEDEFPPLKTLHQTNLPVPTTPFLGREHEVREVTALLARDDARAVTLTGPGGTGKTRLALQAAAASADAFPGGVWWVPLAALRDSSLVLEAAARALGAKGDLAGQIGDERLLLLFDNFEQVVDAAPEVADLLHRAPGVKLLATSREPLRIEGEWEYAVDPMRRADAVALFRTRAVAARRDFVANGEVSQICERLDDLPLAIELAAARVKVLSPRALLERLERRLPVLAGGARDAPDRQRTLRATIEWSHELLTPDEQRLFASLAVFRGGWTLEAAEEGVGADLDTLQSLVDKSLVRQRNDRFWMLETIREYAEDRLNASGEADELGDRHTRYFAALVEEAAPHIRSDTEEWLERLERDHDNLRAAMDRLGETGENELRLRMAARLWRFWYRRSHLDEGRRRLEEALAVGEGATTDRAWALAGASVMYLNLGQPTAARDWAQAALELYRELGDAWGIAYSTMMVGNAYAEGADGGDIAAARDILAETVRMFRELGDDRYALIANVNVAWTTGEAGDLAAEKALHEENLRTARKVGDEGIAATELAQLGMVARDEGRLDDAAELLREAMRSHAIRGNVLELATNLGRLSSVLARKGELVTATTLLAASQAQTEKLGAAAFWWAAKRNAETLRMLSEQLDEATLADAEARGRSLSLDEAVALALT